MGFTAPVAFRTIPLERYRGFTKGFRFVDLHHRRRKTTIRSSSILNFITLELSSEFLCRSKRYLAVIPQNVSANWNYKQVRTQEGNMTVINSTNAISDNVVLFTTGCLPLRPFSTYLILGCKGPLQPRISKILHPKHQCSIKKITFFISIFIFVTKYAILPTLPYWLSLTSANEFWH